MFLYCWPDGGCLRRLELTAQTYFHQFAFDPVCPVVAFDRADRDVTFFEAVTLDVDRRFVIDQVFDGLRRDDDAAIRFRRPVRFREIVFASQSGRS